MSTDLHVILAGVVSTPVGKQDPDENSPTWSGNSTNYKPV
jgi:hypothetical protein